MLNIQTFNDVDGYRVEIDRREVIDAYVHRQDGRSTIEILYGDEGASPASALGRSARWRRGSAWASSPSPP